MCVAVNTEQSDTDRLLCWQIKTHGEGDSQRPTKQQSEREKGGRQTLVDSRGGGRCNSGLLDASVVEEKVVPTITTTSYWSWCSLLQTEMNRQKKRREKKSDSRKERITRKHRDGETERGVIVPTVE